MTSNELQAHLQAELGPDYKVIVHRHPASSNSVISIGFPSCVPAFAGRFRAFLCAGDTPLSKVARQARDRARRLDPNFPLKRLIREVV